MINMTFLGSIEGRGILTKKKKKTLGAERQKNISLLYQNYSQQYTLSDKKMTIAIVKKTTNQLFHA